MKVWLASAHSKEKVQLTDLRVCDKGLVIKIFKLHSVTYYQGSWALII